MTLQQLTYVVALARYRNFVEASRHCYVTQPTLSLQIQKLENYLQVKIFDRTKQPVVPTLLGTKIIENAKLILRESARIEQMVHDAKGLIQGDFKLGIIPSVAGCLIPKFLNNFCKKYPKVNLIISEVQTEMLLESLKNEDLDAGIAATPLSDPKIIEKKIYYEPFFMYVHDKHPFFNKTKISQSDLSTENLLLMSDGHCFKNQALQICGLKNHSKNCRYSFESSNFQTLMQLVEQGLGITLLPYFVTTCLSSNHQKERLKSFKGKIPVREVSFIYTRSVLKEAILNAIYECIFEVIPKDMQLNNVKKNVIISPHL